MRKVDEYENDLARLERALRRGPVPLARAASLCGGSTRKAQRWISTLVGRGLDVVRRPLPGRRAAFQIILGQKPTK